MSEDVRELARKALAKVSALTKAAAGKPLKIPPIPRASVTIAPFPTEPEEVPEERPNKDDALGHVAFRRGGFSKAEKRAYAQAKFLEELVQPPKEPPPEWMSDPELLPKKPPPRAND